FCQSPLGRPLQQPQLLFGSQQVAWANQVGPYQYYIHGSGDVTKYVNLSPSYKSPGDAASKQGVKITLDSTAYWNGQNMRRTELIPQTKAAIASGKIAFFESHFTELKSGWINGEQAASNNNLQFMVQGKSVWKTEWKPDVWHNVAYEINFSSGSVGFWHSEGGAPLQQVVAPVSASTSSNGQDWHLGVLELPRIGTKTSMRTFISLGFTLRTALSQLLSLDLEAKTY
ncbi:hypothetical protein CTA2_6359, partial [Colletotrichum tanaceti]